ncbi:hypothetical protein G6F46_014638 [Rhizopus delemar]|nr:hypothetical protein G6F46_014638 [Rhizopus delemar]
MAGAAHRAGDPADLAARGRARAVDEPRPHVAARGRRGWPGADRTLQRTPAATPAPAADRPPATLAAPGPGRRDAARHLGRPCGRGEELACPGRAWRHHPNDAAGHERQASRAGGVRAGRRRPHYRRSRGC